MKKRKLTRRQFISLAGAVGAGPSIAAADMLAGSSGSGDVLPRPSWVRAADRPKLAVDELAYSRFDKRRTVFFSALGGSYDEYVGEAREQAEIAVSKQTMAKLSQRPGFRPRDRALVAAARTVSLAQGGPNTPNRGLLSWLPLTAGVDEPLPPAQPADPRTVSRELKVAARFLGAALVGICELDRRHVYSYDLDGKAIAFEDVPLPYEADDRRVIPSRCRYAVVYAVRMSSETVKRAPTALASAASNMAYSQLAQLGGSLAEYVRAMGYTAIPMVNDTAVSIPLAVEAGLGELGRHNRLITPEFGSMVRLGKLFTDMPLVKDGPIDAGIMEFCRSCSKCAEACPSGALSFAPEPGFTTSGPWNNPGHPAWFEDSTKCYSYLNQIGTSCMICLSVCPYSKKSRAAVHGLVKSTIAHTDLLNGVLRSVDDAFGYGGQKNPDGWWDLDLPPFGLD